VSASSDDAARRTLPRAALALALGVAIVWLAAHRSYFAAGHLEAQLQELGLWAPAAFVALYAVATVLFVPGSVMTLLGGALFGPLWGTLWNLLGAVLGATLAFEAARYLAADIVTRRAGARLRALVEGVEAEGWRFVAFVRLVPVFPFNLLNYALGLTRIALAEYIIASAVCMLPGAFAYTYLGYAGREAAAHGAGAIRSVALAIGLLAAAALMPRLVRRFGSARTPRK
jgi:uncharacterized membrane protein YdjX (TVP38/TMEM64 family)